MKLTSLLLAIGIACSAGCQHQAPLNSTSIAIPARVTAARLFIRIVADAEATGAFYESLGFEVGGMPLDATGHRPYVDYPAITQMYDAAGQVRFLTCKPLATGPSLLLLEFKDMPKQALRPAVPDVGSTIATVRVKDLEPILTTLAANRVPLLSANGQPVAIKSSPGAQRIVYVRDPDGAFVELREDAHAPADNTGNLLGLSFAISVQDSARSARFYQRVFGVTVTTAQPTTDAARLQAAGLPVKPYQRSTFSFPGTNFDIELLEFKGQSRKPLNPTSHSVGAAILRMTVNDFPAIVSAFKQEGAPILSAGGQPLLMGTSDIFIAPDPNGFILEPSKPRE